jgi:hypothetical protein
MLRPLIVIGCGGSGVNTVRYLRRSARVALDKAGWEGPFPQAWQFIGVDVVTQNLSDPFETEPIPNSDYISIGPGISYQNIQSVMETKHPSGSPGCIEMLGWKPNAAEVNSPITQSAAPRRSVGRIAGLAGLMPQLGRRLTQAHAVIGRGSEEFRQIAQLLTGSESSLNPKDMEPLVIVVGSMVGGTGSAILLDINELVQRTNTEFTPMFNVVYSADVFESLGASFNPGLHANSLAFMSELLAFSWNGGKSSDLIDHVIKKEYLAPPLTFVIESPNLHGQKISNSSKESFQQIASWLTDVAVSPMEQDHLIGALVRKSQHALMTSGGYGFEKSAIYAPPGAIYSLGHAKLTVGRDRFPEYASTLLQRALVEFLLNGDGVDVNSPAKNQSAKPPSLAIRNSAENMLPSFLAGSFMSASDKLDEHFVDTVFNAVDIESFTQLAKSELEKELEAARRSGMDQLSSMTLAVQQATSRYLQGYGSMNSKVIREIDRVMDGILAEVNRSFENSSIPIINEVLRITQQLINQAAGKIRIKAASLSVKSELELNQSVDAVEQKNNVRAGSKPDFSFLDFAANSVSSSFQSLCLDCLAEALEDLANRTLTRITHQLDAAIAILQSRFELMADWPKIDHDVPHWLRPRQFEFCLEGFESWPASLLSLLGKSQFPAADSGEHQVRIARNSILMGGYESHNGGFARPLFEVTTNDVPLIDIQSVENKVKEWLRRRESGFSSFVHEGLSSYLTEFSWTGVKNADYENRLKRYSEALKEVLVACQPLIQIDENLSREIYRSYREAVIAYPDFRLPSLGSAADDMLSKLMSKYLPGGQVPIDRYSGGDHGLSTFSFTSFLNNPLNPSVFRRFTESEAVFVHSRMDSAAPWSFVHKWRRTRRLSEYVPLPTELRHAAIRGFAVGRILGYITVDTNEAIRISGMDREYAFPRRLLTSAEPKNLLPALLESMSLCFADVPIHGQEAFGAYRELISLGVGSDGSPNSFEFDNECLKYITTGSRLRATVDANRVEMMAAETANERQYKMIAYLNDNLSRYEEVLASIGAHPEVNNVSDSDKLTIELIEDLLSNYHIVLESVKRYMDETCIDYF